MDEQTLAETYRKRKTDFAAILQKLSKRINVISNLRLAIAIIFCITLYFTFSQPYLGFVCLLLVIGFTALVQFHARLFRDKTHLENLVAINDSELRILNLDLSGLDAGAQFIDPHHPFSHDLDLFGEGSLFQYINRCSTINAKSKFAQRLQNPLNQHSAILQHHDDVKDLAPRIDFRQHVQAAGMETGEQKDDHEQLLRWTRQPRLFENAHTLKLILYILPAITLAALALTFFIPAFKILLLVAIMAQWIITGSNLKKINVYHDYITRKKNILEKYSRLLSHLANENFDSPHLTTLSKRAQEAHVSVNQLASLVSALDARSNALVTLFVNSFLLYDLQCVFRLERWRETNSDSLKLWLDTIVEIEVLNSFATFSFNHTSFTFPVITHELSIVATDLAHPLISRKERIVNDLRLGPEPSVLIVTGANMAGKSTFLRTIGVNIILALNGAPVCASEFRCPVINLRSGMRTADSLKDHQSYFYAELNRLRDIMDELRNDRPLLILLDEILKGTNSNDKQAGSIALVRQLLPHPCLAIIATHDLALGELQNEYPSQVKNYCFEANIENDQLSFDYKLKEGVAQKMNASFLMKKMGIIPA